MERSEISGAINDHLSENERRRLEDGLGILVKMITRTVLKETLAVESSQHEESPSLALRSYGASNPEGLDERLTLSVQTTAKLLGLSRGSAYEAIRTGQIPSIRFGKRIVVPRAALNEILSQTDTDKSGHT